MVKNQIIANGIQDTNVINAMRTVPRHKFVPPSVMPHAYEDRPLPIGEGQAISQPFIVGYMRASLKGERPDASIPWCMAANGFASVAGAAAVLIPTR